jgi:hypothetical protein
MSPLDGDLPLFRQEEHGLAHDQSREFFDGGLQHPANFTP